MVAEAEAEQAALLKLLEDPLFETRFLHNNVMFKAPDQGILGVGVSMLAGELAFAKKEYDVAFEHLREAVRRDSSLNYDEPWGWMMPTRHALGALLLARGRTQEAEKVFLEDLKQYPSNLWALKGLARCMRMLDRIADAQNYDKLFSIASVHADVDFEHACFCAVGRDTPRGACCGGMAV
eukprot:m.116401 g.116401  ORF g.116401 m.116401 type:complete len:180 (+) comp9501_c0_seq2:1495-2034(+)